MKLITLLLALSLSAISFSQLPELKSSDLVQFTYPFEIVNNKIIGKGADTLIKRIEESQFFMLGEEHGSPQISELTAVMLPYFASSGYKNFALEVGPYTSGILTKEMEKHNSLYPFNRSFFSTYKDIPVPFFGGTKDAVFLRAALQDNFKIWGIDQEFLNAPLFLIDEIFNYSKYSVSTEQAYLKAKTYLVSQYNRFNAVQDNGYFSIFESNNDFSQYMDQCNAPEQKKIIEALRISMQIYKKNSSGAGNFPRMEYMKRNFSNYYKSASKDEVLPKVLVKMGSMHLGWGKSWLGVYDLGNMINELAYFNDTKSVSINCFSRYSEEEDGTVSDYLNDEDGANLSLIVELASIDKWTLVDCKQIIVLARNRRVQLKSDLKFLLARYDYLVFVPLKTRVKNNY